MVHKKLNMKANVVNANAEDTIRDIIKIIQQKELVFFVGSAISFADPSKLLSVSQIKENIINKIYKNGTLIKLHGCVQIPESVITILRRLIRGLPEEREKQLREIIKEKHVLFVGYGGRDEKFL